MDLAKLARNDGARPGEKAALGSKRAFGDAVRGQDANWKDRL
jgi:hypothetical protein